MDNKTIAFIFYGALTVALAYLGYTYSNKFVNVTEQVGALIGGIVGVIICLALWYTVGKKFVESSK